MATQEDYASSVAALGQAIQVLEKQLAAGEQKLEQTDLVQVHRFFFREIVVGNMSFYVESSSDKSDCDVLVRRPANACAALSLNQHSFKATEELQNVPGTNSEEVNAGVLVPMVKNLNQLLQEVRGIQR
eukprot:4834485-Amphidinium_carterae.1